MTDKDLISKLVDVPLARPGFEALTITAPVLVQMNPDGKWENKKPDTLDEERLKAVVQHLVKSKALSAAQSYCCQCASENPTLGATSNNYVPVIIMPIQEADRCQFDMDGGIQKMKLYEETSDADRKVSTTANPGSTSGDSKDIESKKQKKRGFVMQRLTDFDLMSQW